MTTSKFYIKSLVIFLSVFIVISISYLYIIKKQEAKLKDLVEYHTKMIESGSISSLVKLGEMYEKGEGVEKDLIKAKELFKKAINFNKYLDEIYPTHTKSDLPEDNNKNLNYADDDTIKIDMESDETLSSISYPESGITNTTDIIKPESNSDNTSQLNSNLNNNQKFIPYVKNKNLSPKKVQTQNDSFKNVILVKENKQTIKKENKKISKIKPKTKTKHVKKKTKSKKQAKAKIKIKRKQKAKRRKKSPTKKRKLKTAKSTKKPTKRRNKKTKFKKTLVLKKTSSKSKGIVKKTRLEAKRAKTLNEERPDINNELDIYENKIIADSENDAKQKTNKQKLESNFTSNPCDTASARYIAKCRRKNKN